MQPKAEKKTFLTLFSLLSIFLTIAPFLVAFNEGLTKIVESTYIYRTIQENIVPYEVKIVAAILYLLHIPATYQYDGLNVHDTFLRVTWNCLGWQSLLFLLITFLVGLPGSYRFISIIEAVAIGLLGTFLINISRITFIVLLGVYFPSIFSVLFHDYLAVFITVAWLFFFWWFVYKFVLEEKIYPT